jgi:HlyD family secretion protein
VDASNIFRKVSLDRLSSPEQLDQVLEVTTPRGWIALVAISLLLVGGIVWGLVGSLSNKVAGRGILVRSGGVLEVVAPSAGRMADVAVTVGDSVTEGQVIAWMSQPELDDQVAQAKDKLAAVEAQQAEAVQFADRDATLQARTLAQQRQSTEEAIAGATRTQKWLTDRAASQEQLVKQGLMTRTTLVQTRQQLDEANGKISSLRSQLAQTAEQAATVEAHRQETRANAQLQLAQGRAELDQLQRSRMAATRVVSPYTGRILEIMTEQGNVVGRGEPLMRMDLTGSSVQDLTAIVYVPSVQGKTVRPGMYIQIAPSTVRQEEYGMMIGRVTFVSDYPASPKGMLLVLKNDRLVSELSGGDAPYELHAELIVDPTTPSQYRWSSSGGPPMRIQSGTLATATITVDTQRPIARVIPLLRRWTGV